MKEFLISPVSTQTFPIVVSALSLLPEKVILLSTSQMKKFESFIKNVLTYKGIDVEVRYINPYSRESILKAVEDINSTKLLLNCGTKYTSFILFDRFGKDALLYYTPDGKIINFEGKTVLKVKPDIVDVELHSAMYGFKIEEEISEINTIFYRKKMTNYIGINFKKLSTFMKKAFETGYFTKDTPHEFISLALKHNIIKRSGKTFPVIDRNYIGGKWFEEFLFLKLTEKDFFDIHIGVKLSWYNSSITNEIDVIAVKNNRLYLFSCKTGKINNLTFKHIYELHELTKRVGGDFGKGYLCVASPSIYDKPPELEKFPNAPRQPYNPNLPEWKDYFKTPEGKRYRNIHRNSSSFTFLKRRANLLDITVLTIEEIIGNQI
ncbi:Card1-like endonuclease domain-containing protein [Desulfurobacterium atlanticum]|uniref:Card1 endonuclease domain-containing protein n=1 Tax=Desulfurobacterium atlanticum TaxID=240169 RepID=A0A238XQT9_9BACT|nr:DUF1887 family CARF protein [Desulfurobacterium atlanticum]SNR60349.1 protein of unknown function [Desulfurobacterium atlanticum]